MTLASPLEITCVSKLRKGSSAALWSQCFSRSSFFCRGVFKNIRIILLFLFFYLSHVCILIRPSMCFFYNSFRFIFVLISSFTQSVVTKKESNTQDTNCKTEKLSSVQEKMYLYQFANAACFPLLKFTLVA